MPIDILASGLTRVAASHPPQLDVAMLLGFLSSLFTIVCYFHRRIPAFAIGLAIGLTAMSVCAVIQGAWPIGIAEGIWAGVAFGQLFVQTKLKRAHRSVRKLDTYVEPHWQDDSRMSRMFGRN
jgi:hypothetical protein